MAIPHSKRRNSEILGIVARFTVVVTSEAVGVAKPDPRIFTWACHAVAAHPTQCVYVGDRLENGCRAAITPSRMDRCLVEPHGARDRTT